MGLAELFIIAVGLSMDAFAVSVCKGLSVQKLKPVHALACGGYFGGFQAWMPFVGYLLGSQFKTAIERLDHWVAFLLLGIIGWNMIRESREPEEEKLDASFGVRAMLPLAVATSIDALAVGVTFAFLKVDIFWAVAFIGSVTFVLSALGVKAGNVFGIRYKARAEFTGGLILVLMGIKILLEHLGLLVF
ncbi:MAG: manganese efflux pump [Lachnospiraceae bacterium]|nr:manganese efflux pump [Lachnospiraceae bacterium]